MEIALNIPTLVIWAVVGLLAVYAWYFVANQASVILFHLFLEPRGIGWAKAPRWAYRTMVVLGGPIMWFAAFRARENVARWRAGELRSANPPFDPTDV